MLHLTDSGLPNLYLENGYKIGEDKYGSYYSVEDIDGLYRVTAIALASGGGAMTAAELRLLRRRLGITQAELGSVLGRTEQTVLLWERHGRVPDDAAKLIKFMMLNHLEPTMPLRDAFRRLEKRLPEKIVMVRVGNEWMHKPDAEHRQATIHLMERAIADMGRGEYGVINIKRRDTKHVRKRDTLANESTPWLAPNFGWPIHAFKQ